MDRQETIEKVFETVAEAAPHITSGMQHRREYVGEENPSNEKQMEADVWANEILKELITSIEGVGEYASEEEQEITRCGDGLSVTIDPLDGSSNIPTNNLVGTIVGIYDSKLPCKGENLVSAFYILYGPLTTAVKTENNQVNEYVIEEKKGDQVELVKASENIQINKNKVYGFGGNKKWTDKFREIESEYSRNQKLRYGGALVGDFNQVLHHGGIFGYPQGENSPEGKYRLIFEANPMAHIAEKANAKSIDGEKDIKKLEPEKLHERTPFFTGEKQIINQLKQELI